MIGLVLETMGGTLQGDASKLIQTYLKDSLTASVSRDFVKPVLAEMITEAGTKEPHTEAELLGKTHFEPWQMKATLADLARRGLVRRLEGEEATWEIAHDFLARTIGQLIGRLKPTLVEWARPLVAPVVLLGWVIIFAAALPFSRVLQLQAVEKALRENFRAKIGARLTTNFKETTSMRIPGKPGSILVELAPGDDRELARAVHFLGQLDELRLILRVEATSGITSLEPLKALTNLSELYLLNDGRITKPIHITSLEPIKGLIRLSRIDLSGVDGITSIQPLKGLANLESLVLNATDIINLELLNSLPRLHGLALSGVKSLEPIKDFPSLHNLLIYDVTGITSLEPLKNALLHFCFELLFYDVTAFWILERRRRANGNQVVH
jgi:hypothetical protein